MNNALSGEKILVTRPALQAVQLAKLIEQQGGEAILFPTLKIEALQINEQISRQLKALFDYQHIIFISKNAVNFALRANNGKIDAFKHAKISAIGNATAKSLLGFGLNTGSIPIKGFTSEDLLTVPHLQNIENKKILIVRGQGGRETLAKKLIDRGADVDYLEVYKREMPIIDNSNVINLLKQQQL